MNYDDDQGHSEIIQGTFEKYENGFVYLTRTNGKEEKLDDVYIMSINVLPSGGRRRKRKSARRRRSSRRGSRRSSRK